MACTCIENNEEKRKYFEAFLYELLKWWKEKNGDKPNDLNKLKVLKLFFLGLGASKKDEYLKIFDSFEAWRLGPVEVDFINCMNNVSCSEKNFSVGLFSTRIRNGTYEPEDRYKDFAEDIIKALKNKNEDLINLSSDYLVEITHKWKVWQFAREYNKKIIPSVLLKYEEGFFGIKNI